MKIVSQRVGTVFQRLIQMLHKTLKTKDNVSPRSNKAETNCQHSQPIALWCLQANNYFEHQNSASERIWSCLINKEEFVATYIETFAEQQPMYPPEI